MKRLRFFFAMLVFAFICVEGSSLFAQNGATSNGGGTVARTDAMPLDFVVTGLSDSKDVQSFSLLVASDHVADENGAKIALASLGSRELIWSRIESLAHVPGIQHFGLDRASNQVSITVEGKTKPELMGMIQKAFEGRI